MNAVGQKNRDRAGSGPAWQNLDSAGAMPKNIYSEAQGVFR